MGTRQRSQLPIKDSRKRLKSPINKRKINNSEVLQDQESLSSGKSNSKAQARFAPHLKDPLTPLHRLRRFKEIRDRNLRKGSLRPKRLEGKKMSVDMEKEETDGSKNAKEIKPAKEKHEKIINGTQENGEKHPDESIVTEKNVAVVEDKEENFTPGKKLKEKVELTEINEVKEQQMVKKVIEKIEKEEIKLNEEEVKIDDISEDEEVEVLKVDTEEDDNSRDGDNEAVNEKQQEDQLKILRCSFREELSVGRDSPQPSTSKQDLLSLAETQSTSSELSIEKRCSLSPETVERFKSYRVEGRRSLYHFKPTGYRKRKLDDDYEYGSVISEKKKQALKTGRDLMNSPSVLSPGWKFISSPFTRFWTPHETPKPGHTPYKSVSLTTPYPDNDNEDSMAVNYDDKSLYSNLNDSDLGLSIDSSQSTTNSGWRCNIM